MKIISEWKSLNLQVNALKISVLFLSALSLTIGIGAVSLALKNPVVIREGDANTAAQNIALGSVEPTADEVTSFLRLAISARFSPETKSSAFISSDELQSKAREEQDLSQRGMKQRVYFISANVSGNDITAECDRVIAVGALRSVVPLNLKIEVARVTRSRENPSGLVLKRLSQIKEPTEAGK
jgi:hypothetical protein